jgi:hypothetical protein
MLLRSLLVVTGIGFGPNMFNAGISAVNEKILRMNGHVRLSELEQNNEHVYC